MSYGRRRESYGTSTTPVRRPSYSTPTFTSTYNTGSSGLTTTRYGAGSTGGYSGSTGGYSGSTGGYSGGYDTGSAYSSGYDAGSAYSRPSAYGGISSGYGSGSSYTGAYSSPYSTSSGASSYSTPTGGYSSSYSGRSTARDSYEPYGSSYDTTTNSYGIPYDSTTSYGSNAYNARRSARDRSTERSSDNLYTPRAARRSSGNSDYKRASGIQKSASYSGMHWMRDNPQDRYESDTVSSRRPADPIRSTHRRQGSNSSNTSLDAVFDDKSGLIKRGSQKKREEKRDLETILGREDHLLVQRILEENKQLFVDAPELELSPQEKRLIQTISEAARSGSDLNCLEVLQIIQSH